MPTLGTDSEDLALRSINVGLCCMLDGKKDSCP